MQDRFKFRVWCENNQEWEKDTILISNKNMYEIRNDKFTKYTDIDPKNHIINFCTGLKDKNGKLIFEGDIVTIATKYSGNLKGYVYYDLHTLQFKIDIKGYANRDLIYFVDKYGVIIIGNIYENPELLEEKQMLSINDINLLQSQNEGLKKQNTSLQKELRRKNEQLEAVSNELDEYVQRLTTHEFELLLQDEYFKGLNVNQILELARKSIRLTAENRELEKENEKLKEKVRCQNAG